MIEELQVNLVDTMNISISDEDFLKHLADTESNFIERKTISDSRGWLKTAVAFANSCPIGYPGLLYVGVNDDGTIQKHQGTHNFEKLQKSVTERINEAWPPIYHFTKVLNKEGSQFIAVVIPGSSLRPHFSGPAFVRVGPKTKDASEEEYDKLIAQRSSKVRALQKLIGKLVYWDSLSPTRGNANGTVVGCNQFFLTIDGGTYKRCFPIDWITISYDPANQRYMLIAKA